MKVKPHNGKVLCKCLNDTKHEATECNVVFQKEELPLYEIIDVGDVPIEYGFNVGDVIVSNSTPTRLNLEGTILWLIDKDNIAGKVEK